MSEEVIDTEVEPRQEIATVRPDGEISPQLSAQEQRTNQVAQALAPAYARASTLVLTPEESAALSAPFDDEAVEIREFDGLIYLPHIEISNRLNRVLGIGQWAIIRRREWFDADTSTMYGDYCLLIRGCLVGDAIGGHPYNPQNRKTNYSDALESTRAEALRRIAGKCLSCGDQVWKPSYSRSWVTKHAIKDNGKWRRRENPVTEPAKREPSPAPSIPAIMVALNKAADMGTAALQKQWAELTREERVALKEELPHLKERAREADETAGV